MKFFGPWPAAVLALSTTATAAGRTGRAVADLGVGTLGVEQATAAALWLLCGIAAVAWWIEAGSGWAS